MELSGTLLTVSEAAARLRLGRSTVYLMLQNGELPSVRLRNAWRVPSDALDEWLRRQVHQPANAVEVAVAR